MNLCHILMPRHGSPNYGDLCECLLPNGHKGPHESIARGRKILWEFDECEDCWPDECECFVWWEKE